ncbi:hypothetical protein [Micrococcoides hystricis]|uniref:PE-PPE domain-containing protein n=1 Tax=Micrococcoides hystricis TaxID=1572761 RepID=A0ABV6P7U6_9MICC
MSAVLEELGTASIALKAVSTSLNGYQSHLVRAQLLNITNPPPRIALLAPWWGAAMLSCTNTLTQLQAGATKTQAQAALIAAGLTRAKEAYARVELEVARSFNELNKYPALLRSVTAIATGNRPGGRDVETVIENMPAYAGDLLYLATPLAFSIGTLVGGPAGGLILGGAARAGAHVLPQLRHKRYGGLFDRTVADRLYGVITKTGGQALRLSVEPVEVAAISQPTSHRVDASFSGLMALVPTNDGTDAGSITISTINKADGTTHTVIAFPGTEGAAAAEASGGTSPFSINGLAEATTLGSQHVNAGVMEALEQTAIPAGSTVTLIGFSQGGKHAMNLAADERFAKKYKTQMVITAGSPVAQTAAQLPTSVKTLHLEHKDDPVPGLDGAANPHSINRITLGLSGYAVPTSKDTVFGAGHNFDNYVATLRSVEAQNLPDLHAHQAQLAQSLGTQTPAGTAPADGIVEVSTQTVKLRHISAKEAELQGGPHLLQQRQ